MSGFHTGKQSWLLKLDDAVAQYSQELKETLPEGVLSIAIRADFWQPQKNERKAELIKY